VSDNTGGYYGSGYGAGIGGGRFGSGGSVSISGGSVSATKGYNSNRSDIGPGHDGSDGTVIIITGGSVNCAVFGTPSNGSAPVYRSTLMIGSDAAIINTPIAAAKISTALYYGVKDATTDSSGKLHFWLPENPSARIDVAIDKFP
jgi:hypothetical protein